MNGSFFSMKKEPPTSVRSDSAIDSNQQDFKVRTLSRRNTLTEQIQNS